MKESKYFENRKVRSHYDESKQEWYFSIVDVIGVLTEQPTSDRARNYWKVLKSRLIKEGNESVTNCNQLKMLSADGKYYMTDVGNVEQIFRLIQSIPSPKAEPFKLWLAKVGYERMQEIQDPSISVERARDTWRKKGRSEAWIEKRIRSQETRNQLTEYWADNGVKKNFEFAFLTNVIHQEWTDLSIKQHKELKGIKSQNLREHMSETELIFSTLAEFSAYLISEVIRAEGLKENTKASRKGGAIAKNARKELEAKTGKDVVTNHNFLLTSKKKLK